jgi:hypothetical protein
MVVFNQKKSVKPTKPKQTALAKAGPSTDITTIEDAKSILVLALSNVVAVFGGRADITPSKASEAFGILKDVEKLVTDSIGVAKTKMQELVRTTGVPVEGTKGTIRSLELGYEIRPTRTGFDAKKVEARFRAKNVDVNKYMDPVVTYVLNDGKLLAAAADGVLTKDELEACRYDESFSVVKSKPGADQ